MSGVGAIRLAYRAGAAAKPQASLWWSARETYPIVVCMGVAIGWTCYMMTRALIVNPDVINGRIDRGSPLKDDAKLITRGEAWVASQKKHIAADPSKISLFNSYERKFA